MSLRDSGAGSGDKAANLAALRPIGSHHPSPITHHASPEALADNYGVCANV